MILTQAGKQHVWFSSCYTSGIPPSTSSNSSLFLHPRRPSPFPQPVTPSSPSHCPHISWRHSPYRLARLDPPFPPRYEAPRRGPHLKSQSPRTVTAVAPSRLCVCASHRKTQRTERQEAMRG